LNPTIQNGDIAMPSQNEKANTFHALHVKGDPIVLYNIWDPGSAATVEKAGAKALATGSWPVAVAQGYGDGENIPMTAVLDNASRIVAGTDLPVTLDFEGGYAEDEAGLKANIAEALATGVIGFNFEDQIIGGKGLHEIDAQAKRVAAVRSAIDDSGINAYLNARTDLFLKSKPEDHAGHLDEAIERAKAYEDAGASGFFAPALLEESLIEKLCSSTSLPVNIIAIPGCPPKETLADLGVARISYGPVPYRSIMKVLEEGARQAFA
jgi:2-methylisocitrate lyase-like PEP mutase family enzyme